MSFLQEKRAAVSVNAKSDFFMTYFIYCLFFIYFNLLLEVE